MSTKKKEYYAGVRFAPYDLIREFLLAMVVMTALVFSLAAFLSSPDEAPLTLKGIANGSPAITQSTPKTFLQDALTELDGSSDISSYGPPYNNGTGSVQYIGPFSPQKWAGVRIPINTAKDLVLDPLLAGAGTNPGLHAALERFKSASVATQNMWLAAYGSALDKSTPSGKTLVVACPVPTCGPVTLMMASMLKLGQSGALDGLLGSGSRFYQTDYTRSLLFMQNSAIDNAATYWNLQGDTWGAMNETGNYPGQAWLWLFTLLYQIPPYTTAWAANTDALAMMTISLLTLILLLLPWIPGLNRLPYWLKVYRLIWRDHYKEVETTAGAASESKS